MKKISTISMTSLLVLGVLASCSHKNNESSINNQTSQKDEVLLIAQKALDASKEKKEIEIKSNSIDFMLEKQIKNLTNEKRKDENNEISIVEIETSSLQRYQIENGKFILQVNNIDQNVNQIEGLCEVEGIYSGYSNSIKKDQLVEQNTGNRNLQEKMMVKDNDLYLLLSQDIAKDLTGNKENILLKQENIYELIQNADHSNVNDTIQKIANPDSILKEIINRNSAYVNYLSYHKDTRNNCSIELNLDSSLINKIAKENLEKQSPLASNVIISDKDKANIQISFDENGIDSLKLYMDLNIYYKYNISSFSENGYGVKFFVNTDLQYSNLLNPLSPIAISENIKDCLEVGIDIKKLLETKIDFSSF